MERPLLSCHRQRFSSTSVRLPAPPYFLAKARTGVAQAQVSGSELVGEDWSCAGEDKGSRRTISVLFLNAARDTFHFTICNYNSQSNTMVYAVTRTRVTRESRPSKTGRDETGTSRVVRLLKTGKGEQYVRIIKNGYRSGCVGRRCHSSAWSGD